MPPRKNLPTATPDEPDESEAGLDVLASLASPIAEAMAASAKAQQAVSEKKIAADVEMGKRQLDSFDRARALDNERHKREHATIKMMLWIVVVVLGLAGAFMFFAQDPELFKAIVFALIGAVAGWGARGAMDKRKEPPDGQR